MQELDAAMKTFEQLKPQCADAGASYAERKAKRDAEIKSLEEVPGVQRGGVWCTVCQILAMSNSKL